MCMIKIKKQKMDEIPLFEVVKIQNRRKIAPVEM